MCYVLINIKISQKCGYPQVYTAIQNSVHSSKFHPQKMWTECRAHSDFALFEIATKFSIWWGGLMSEIVKKLHKSMNRWMFDERLCRMEERMLSVFKRLENIDGTI